MARLGLKFVGKGVSERIRKMAAAMPNIVDDELYDIAKEMQGDFEKTTKTFEHGVEFEVTRIDGEAKGWGVSTDDEIWNWIDQGTPPHIIVPVNAPMLRFNQPFVPKTRVRNINSYKGEIGTMEVVAQEVHHPGVEAREFTEVIVERWQPKVGPRVRKKMNEGIEAMGL